MEGGRANGRDSLMGLFYLWLQKHFTRARFPVTHLSTHSLGSWFLHLQALRHCPDFEPRSRKGPVAVKIHSLSLRKIQLDSKIVQNCKPKSPCHPLHRINLCFFRGRTLRCRQVSPLAQPTNLPCAPQPLVAGSRRWRHRVRLDEAVISSGSASW